MRSNHSLFLYAFRSKGTPPILFILILLSAVGYVLYQAAQSGRKKQQQPGMEMPYDRQQQPVKR
jgi:hypothetical protein